MAKRFSLREYQESMLLRMQEVTATAQADARLGLAVGEQHWLVKLADVAEVLPPPPIAEVPLTQNWFRGVANVRGNLASVVDLQAFFYGESQPLSSLSRLLLIQPRLLPHAAVLVNRMRGIRHTDRMTSEPLPADAPSWLSAVYKDESGQIWQEMDMAKLTGEQAFLQAGLIA